MKTKEVFTPGQFPTLTFIGEHLSEKAKYLRGALEAGGLIISISGPSKSGKTVFIEKEIGKENLIHITGAGIDSAIKLWGRVFDIIGTPISTETTANKSFKASFGGKAGGEAGILVKGHGEVSASGDWQRGESTKLVVEKDPLQLAIKELKDSGFWLFIDDFHYVSAQAKPEIANQLKECLRQGLNVIVAAVPYHSDDVIRSNNDLRGRMLKLDFNYWDASILTKIAQKGFGQLAIKADDTLVEALAAEAAGSPQLMQALCLNLCFEMDVYEKCDHIHQIQNDPTLFRKVCARTALMTDFSTTVSLMQEGPKTRGTVRHVHPTKEFGSLDVYPLVLKAVSANPPQLTFRYADLTDRIQSICNAEGPAGSSVTGACYHMARIANESVNATVVEWDSEHDVLDIRDPYLLFFLRWA